MENGIYDMTDEEYFALNYPSNSKLLKLRNSPKHLKWDMDNPESTTPAMRFGQAFHCAVLQPEVFDREWAILPAGDGRTKEVKEAREAVLSKYGNNVLSVDDYGRIIAMKKAIESHEKANSLLNSVTQDNREKVVVWIDNATGLKCKAKIDGISKLNLLIDIKTTTDASLDAFSRSIATYGYHRQAAFYLAGVNYHGITSKNFIFIAIEKDPPYAIGVYNIDYDSIAHGHAENMNALFLWKQCSEKGEYPDYNEGKIIDISMPSWAKKEKTNE